MDYEQIDAIVRILCTLDIIATFSVRSTLRPQFEKWSWSSILSPSTQQCLSEPIWSLWNRSSHLFSSSEPLPEPWSEENLRKYRRFIIEPQAERMQQPQSAPQYRQILISIGRRWRGNFSYCGHLSHVSEGPQLRCLCYEYDSRLSKIQAVRFMFCRYRLFKRWYRYVNAHVKMYRNHVKSGSYEKY